MHLDFVEEEGRKLSSQIPKTSRKSPKKSLRKGAKRSAIRPEQQPARKARRESTEDQSADPEKEPPAENVCQVIISESEGAEERGELVSKGVTIISTEDAENAADIGNPSHAQ